MFEYRTGYANATEHDGLSYRRFFLRDEFPRMLNLAKGLAKRLAAEEVYLLTQFKGDCWVVVLNAGELFIRVSSVIDFDGDSLCALSKDGSQGVLIDHNRDDREQTYEMTVWGDRWPLLVLAFD